MEFTLLLGIMHCYKGQEYTNIMPAQALTLLRETLVRLLSQENAGEDIFWKGSVCVELRYSRLGKERRQPEVLWKATRPTQVSQDEEGHRAGKGDTNCGETRCPGGTNSSFPTGDKVTAPSGSPFSPVNEVTIYFLHDLRNLRHYTHKCSMECATGYQEHFLT